MFNAKPAGGVGAGEGASVYTVAFSPDGRTLAAAESNGIALWDVATGAKRQSFLVGGENTFALAFAPDGATLASGGTDRTIRLWSAATGKLIRELKGHEDAVASLAFTPDGQVLVSGSGAGPRKAGGSRPERAALRLWNPATGAQVGRLGDHGDGVVSLGFSRDGKTLMSAGGGSVRLWDFPARREMQDRDGHHGWVGSIAFSPDGAAVATGGADNTVRLWSVATARQIRVLEGLTGDVDGFWSARPGAT